MNVIQPPHPVLDKRGEPHVRRYEEQRWLIDNVIRANGIDWDQPRSLYLNGPCGNEANADFAGIRERVKKMADIGPAFEAVARRREAKAQAAEEIGHKVTARDNYFMAAVHWGAAQWPYDQNNETNIAYNNKKRECYAKYAALADHHIVPVWVPFKDKAIPAWFHLPPGYKGGRIPVVINVPGMDSFKEIQVALYGDRFLNRGIAVLAIDGPGQYEAPMVGVYFSVENWAAVGKPLVDWLVSRPEVDPERIGCSGTSFGTFFGTILTAHEPRIRAFAAMSVCHEPGCHTIFQEASPTFKKRFMYMSGITDERRVRPLPPDHHLGGPRRQDSRALSRGRRRGRGIEPGRAFRTADQDRAGAEAHGGVSGIAPFGRQRAGGQSRPVPADPGRGLDGGPARRQIVPERALVRAFQRADRQDADLSGPVDAFAL